MAQHCLLPLLCWLGMAGSAAAELEFTPPWIDLGEVRAGQVFQHQIKVTNTGSTAVQVRELKAGCGCMKPKLQPELLEPGQTGLLTVQVNTLSAPPGVQGWRIRLYLTNGSEAEFVFRADVKQEILLTPAALTLYGDKPGSHTITVTDHRTRPLTLLTATTTSSLLTAVVVTPTSVQLQVKEGFAEGRHEEEVLLTTDDPTYPLLRFPVKIVKRARQRFSALPRDVELQTSANEPLLSRIVTVRDQQGQPMVIDRVQTSHPALKAEVVATQAGFATLKITLDGSTLGGAAFTGRVLVVFRGTAQTLTIPVRCP